MNKIWLIIPVFILTAAVADARYVRKLREPDFFIPAGDRMHKPEKLPEIKAINQQKAVKKEVFTSVPEYKTKYNKYLADMAVFANSKVLRDNVELDIDLAAMENGDIFEVTAEAPQKVTAREQKEFYLLVKKILEN